MSNLLHPIYTSERANGIIELDQADVEVTASGRIMRGVGTAKLRLFPRFDVIATVNIPAEPDDFQLFEVRKASLRFGAFGLPTETIILRHSRSESSHKLELLPSSGRLMICRDPRKRLQSVTFHVANFPEFFCSCEGSVDILHEEKNKYNLLGRVLLQDKDWQIEIQALPEAGALVKQLKVEGGYAITHVGRLTRAAGRTFSISSAESVLDKLHLFLSFVRGFRTPIFGSVGFNKDQELVFKEWGMRQSTPWESVFSCFDPHHSEILSNLFGGFMKLLRNSELGEAISSALYWYLRSNRAGSGPGIDGGLILSQAALERLTCAYLTTKMLSVRGPASKLIRQGLVDLGISTAIPKETATLFRGQNRGTWMDGPDAIAQARNDLVHPKRRIKFEKNYIETWQLAQWYIELLILRLAGYTGVYSNRLRRRFVGQVESVPWVTEKTGKGYRKRTKRSPD